MAFGKLDGRLDSAPLKLASRDKINAVLGATTLGMGAVVMGAPELGTGMAALTTALTTSGVLGWHMTASIGGAGAFVFLDCSFFALEIDARSRLLFLLYRHAGRYHCTE